LLTSNASRHTFNAVVNKQENVSAVFAALADPTRRRIMHHLSQHGESRVTALAKPFRISLPAISRHLRVLENARLIQRHRQGREHLIRSRATGLDDARKWIAQCAAGWESGFDRLEELLKTAQLPYHKPPLNNEEKTR
jgi:DNA-binding transcriptional ArsR family regulator